VLSKDGFEKASFVKDLHHHIKQQIERKVGKYAEHAKKGCNTLIFQPREWVWLHLRKDRFPTYRKSKLMPRGDGSFQVIKRINDNAYELDLPNTYLGSHSFNISYVTPFSTGLPNSWKNSLPPREHDETQGERVPTNDEDQAQTMTSTPKDYRSSQLTNESTGENNCQVNSTDCFNKTTDCFSEKLNKILFNMF